jgi:hypothetical protein
MTILENLNEKVDAGASIALGPTEWVFTLYGAGWPRAVV